MKNIRAIIFDADDTLIDHRECERQALIHVFANLGIAYNDEYQNVFRPLDRALWNGTYGVPIPKSDIPVYRFQRLFELFDIQCDQCEKANELFKEGLAGTSALSKNAEEIIRHLHDEGFILCVATNGLTALQKPRVTNSTVGRYISHITVSEEVGADKPNPLIFQSLLKKIDVPSANAVMIGDSLEKDIQGAKNAGIKSIWYNPDNIENKTDIIPDNTINDLLQIKGIVRAE